MVYNERSNRGISQRKATEALRRHSLIPPSPPPITTHSHQNDVRRNAMTTRMMWKLSPTKRPERYDASRDTLQPRNIERSGTPSINIHPSGLVKGRWRDWTRKATRKRNVALTAMYVTMPRTHSMVGLLVIERGERYTHRTRVRRRIFLTHAPEIPRRA